MVNEERKEIQLEAFDKLEQNNFRGAIVLPTGVGKSYILIEALKRLYTDGCSVLYTCDNRKLRDEDFPNELKKWGAGEYLDYIDRMCYQSAYKLENNYYDILLMDEGDYALTKNYINILKNNTFKYIIFVSATLEDEKRAAIENYIPVVYEKKMYDLDGKGIVNDAKLYVVNYLLSPQENRKYLSYNDAFKMHLNRESKNTFALNLIKQGRKQFLGKLVTSQQVCHKLMKKLYTSNPANKILIFCLLSEQADAICKYSYHSKNAKNNQNLQLFDVGDIRILSVVGKIDRGINLNGVNNIIFEAPMESKTKLTQKSGRGRRLDVDDTLSIYFLVPYYKDRRGEVKPTIVEKWVQHSIQDLDLPIVTYKL